MLTLKINSKFVGKLTCRSKKWGIWQIFTRAHLKVWKLGLLLGCFVQSRNCMSLKFTWELCVMTMKNDSKFEQEFTFQFKIDIRYLKICTIMGSFCPKYIMFELSKCRVVMFNDTECWCKIWRKTDMSFQKWHDEFGKLLFTVWKIAI